MLVNQRIVFIVDGVAAMGRNNARCRGSRDGCSPLTPSGAVCHGKERPCFHWSQTVRRSLEFNVCCLSFVLLTQPEDLTSSFCLSILMILHKSFRRLLLRSVFEVGWRSSKDPVCESCRSCKVINNKRILMLTFGYICAFPFHS